MPLEHQINGADLIVWQSKREFSVDEDRALNLKLARAALAKNPQSANLWLNYSAAALLVNDRPEAHRALMTALWLVPFDTTTMMLRLHLIGELHYLMAEDDVRVAINFVRWVWEYDFRGITMELASSDGRMERFLRLRLAQVDKSLFLKIINHGKAK